jgi:hypothetical protein
LQDDYEGDVLFMSVIREDASGDPATPEYAESYADREDFDNVPSVSDIGGNWAPFMGDGYPTNIIINLETMEFRYKRGGLMTATDITNRVDSELQK